MHRANAATPEHHRVSHILARTARENTENRAYSPSRFKSTGPRHAAPVTPR